MKIISEQVATWEAAYHSAGDIITFSTIHLGFIWKTTGVFSNQALHECFIQYQFNQSRICLAIYAFSSSVYKTSFRIPLCSDSNSEEDTNENRRA